MADQDKAQKMRWREEQRRAREAQRARANRRRRSSLTSKKAAVEESSTSSMIAVDLPTPVSPMTTMTGMRMRCCVWGGKWENQGLCASSTSTSMLGVTLGRDDGHSLPMDDMQRNMMRRALDSMQERLSAKKLRSAGQNYLETRCSGARAPGAKLRSSSHWKIRGARRLGATTMINKLLSTSGLEPTLSSRCSSRCRPPRVQRLDSLVDEFAIAYATGLLDKQEVEQLARPLRVALCYLLVKADRMQLRREQSPKLKRGHTGRKLLALVRHGMEAMEDSADPTHAELIARWDGVRSRLVALLAPHVDGVVIVAADALFDWFFSPHTVTRFVSDAALLEPRALMFDAVRKFYGPTYDQLADVATCYASRA